MVPHAPGCAPCERQPVLSQPPHRADRAPLIAAIERTTTKLMPRTSKFKKYKLIIRIIKKTLRTSPFSKSTT